MYSVRYPPLKLNHQALQNSLHASFVMPAYTST